MKQNYMTRMVAAALLALCCLPMNAQLSGTSYYRVKNVGTGNYISLENNLFDYETIIAKAGNGAKHMFSYSMFLIGTIADDYGVPAALSCASAYLKTDIHMVDDPDCELPSTIIYLENNSGDSYDIKAQSTGLVQLTTGSYSTSNINCTFKDLYATVKRVNGSGANTKYSVSEKLTGTGTASSYGISKTITIGTEYFLDDGNSFGMTEDYNSSNNQHLWYIEPVTAINVTASMSYSGKYYTTYYTAFPYTIGGNIEHAYAVTKINDNGNLEIEAIEGTVPACTPVLLECSSKTGNYIVPTGAPTVVASTATPTTSYTGTNLMKGTFFCNTDGKMYFDCYTGNTVGTKGTTTPNGKSFDADNITAPTAPQKYVLGLTASGKLGFVKPDNTVTAMPANKAWIEYTGTAELVLPFEAETTLLGDVNRDKAVTIADVTALVNILRGGDTQYDPKAADVNEKNGVDVDDINALVDMILNQE